MKGTFSNSKHGFTLVELVVVIAIIAILSGVGFAAYTGYVEYTQKGVDRQTVGEIIHALELADYADPGLFGENGGAMVVLSNTGIKAAGGTVGSDIEGALEDTFGGLESTSLSYDKWDGTADTSVFSGLGGAGTQVSTYIEKLKDDKISAAFANDMEEYWEAFEVFVNNPINASGADVDTKDIVKQVVDFYNGSSFNANTVISSWKKGELTGVGGFGGMDLTLARNYAFISYLKQQNLSADARTAVDDYLKKHPYDVMDSVTNFNWCEKDGVSSDVKMELSKFVDSYKNNQAEADARAYFGLMEAAAQVQSNLKDGYTDADFLAALDPYVPMVSNVLTGQTDLKAIQDLTKDLSGPVILVSLTKRGGALRMTVSPEDADPRGGGKAEAAPFEPGTADVATKITVDLEKGTVTTNKGTGNNIVVMKAENGAVLSAGSLKYTGYKIVSAICNNQEKQYSDSDKIPVQVTIDGFTINLAGTTAAQTFTISSKDASAGKSVPVTIRFKLESKTDHSEKEVSLSFTLYAV